MKIKGREDMSGSGENDSENGAPGASGRLEEAQLDHIGVELRAMYDALLREPVPARLLDLLAELDAAADAHAAAGASKDGAPRGRARGSGRGGNGKERGRA